MTTEGFHNPYNFVPVLPRGVAAGTPLGDGTPARHGRHHRDLWTGRIEVTMTVVTPLLLLDHARRRGGDRDHKAYPVRMLDGDRPYVAATAVKGMLRAAYEAVTNSRMGVLGDWDKRLGYRRETQTALSLEPVRIENGRIEFLKSARLARYPREESTDGRGRKRRAVRPLAYVNTDQLPEHGDHAYAIVDRKGTVRAIARSRGELEGRRAEGRCVEGWVHRTGRNIEGKAYERFFYRPPEGTRRPADLAAHPHLERRWLELMADSMDANRSERDEPDRPERSLHLRPEGESIRRFEQPLLAYARCEGAAIDALYPVAVARDLHDRPPIESLDESLRPATGLAELSPADRVFGWLAKGRGGAHRGQLRVGPVEPAEGCRPVPIPGGLPLAILSSPKPQQVRFYLGDPDGRLGSAPQPPGRSLPEAGYGPPGTRVVRGRKVYPHQRDLERLDWWRPDVPGREYLGQERTDQNITVDGWVPPGSRFTFAVEVTNLGDVELGALAWLLTRDDVCFKLGAGRPLGFGSVRLEVSAVRLARGRDLAARYRAFGDLPAPPSPDPRALAEGFEDAVHAAYGRPAAELPFVAAFLVAGRGVSGPVHYPRLTERPDPAGENFRWFTRNEGGRRLSLPPLGARLPYDPGR